MLQSSAHLTIKRRVLEVLEVLTNERRVYLAVGHIFVIDVLLSEDLADSVKHHVHVPGNLDRNSVHSGADSLHRSLDILKHKNQKL